MTSRIDESPGPDVDDPSRRRHLEQLMRVLQPRDEVGDVRRTALRSLALQILEAETTPQAPSREILARLGDRWSPLLILVLSTGRYRHTELRRAVTLLSMMAADTPVSQRMLTLRLRVLERDGLVSRMETPGRVARVDYELTPLGQGLADQISALMRWCMVHSDAMREAQRAYDARISSTGDAHNDAVLIHRSL